MFIFSPPLFFSHMLISGNGILRGVKTSTWVAKVAAPATATPLPSSTDSVSEKDGSRSIGVVLNLAVCVLCSIRNLAAVYQPISSRSSLPLILSSGAHSKCSADKSYNECGSLCLKTCTNREQTTCPGDHCVEGCLCPPGNVLDANSLCIPEAMCPCEYQGLEYVDGDSVSMGCESW